MAFPPQAKRPLARVLAVGLVSFALVAAIGCKEEEQVRVYQVPKQPKPVQMPNVAASAGPQQRMLAAILPAGTQVWHFKLQGPADGVGGQKDQFETFLKSVSFTSAGQPQWTVP